MEEKELKFQDIIKILKIRWKIIFLITIILTIVVAIISFYFIKPVYQVNTKVFIGKNQSSSNLEEYNNNDVMMYQNLLKTYSELMKSNDLIEDAISKNNLEITPEEVSGGLEVNPRIDTQILEISYQSYDNVLAQKVLTSVVDEFIEYTNELIPNGKVKVIESAKLPEYPFKPNRMRNIVLACLIGFLLGSILAFFLEYIDDTLKTKEQTEKKIELPVIGMIPCESKKKIKRGRFKHERTPISI